MFLLERLLEMKVRQNGYCRELFLTDMLRVAKAETIYHPTYGELEMVTCDTK